MSDGMSDSRPFQTDKEELTEIEGIELKKPLTIWVHHFRDGTVYECILLGIEMSFPSHSMVRLEDQDAVIFGSGATQEMSRALFLKALRDQLKKKSYQKYVKEK